MPHGTGTDGAGAGGKRAFMGVEVFGFRVDTGSYGQVPRSQRGVEMSRLSAFWCVGLRFLPGASSRG